MVDCFSVSCGRRTENCHIYTYIWQFSVGLLLIRHRLTGNLCETLWRPTVYTWSGSNDHISRARSSERDTVHHVVIFSELSSSYRLILTDTGSFCQNKLTTKHKLNADFLFWNSDGEWSKNDITYKPTSPVSGTLTWIVSNSINTTRTMRT